MSVSQGGGTLIEVLVTVAVIAIVAALSLPNLSGWFDKGRLVSEMDRVAGRLSYLRQQAVLQGRAYRLQLQSGSYLTYAYDGAETVQCGNTLSPLSSLWSDLSLQPDAPQGAPQYALSPPMPQLLSAQESGCTSGTGLCRYPGNGICFDASGRASSDGGVVQYVESGISRRKIVISESGHIQRLQRRSATDSWSSY